MRLFATEQEEQPDVTITVNGIYKESVKAICVTYYES